MSKRFSAGAAYIDGRYMPLRQAMIPITDWAYRRSDVTYDVVSVWLGLFFRLDDHIARFRKSMCALRLAPVESDDDIRCILHRCVQLSGLRDAYVAMDCLRGRPVARKAYHPAYCRNYIIAFARPWIDLMTPEVQARGAHLIVARVPRIPDDSIDPSVKNFHWGDLTRGLFEAYDVGADGCVLLDNAGCVTEGPGYNIFSVSGGEVSTPNRGALEGVTRQSVLELCTELRIPCHVRPVRVQDLLQADEIFVTTTAGGPMPVSRIDDHVMGNDRPGPISLKLKDTYWKKREAGWYGTPVDYCDNPVWGSPKSHCA
jgi:branched-chain amino acid aminotransferase